MGTIYVFYVSVYVFCDVQIHLLSLVSFNTFPGLESI